VHNRRRIVRPIGFRRRFERGFRKAGPPEDYANYSRRHTAYRRQGSRSARSTSRPPRCPVAASACGLEEAGCNDREARLHDQPGARDVPRVRQDQWPSTRVATAKHVRARGQCARRLVLRRSSSAHLLRRAASSMPTRCRSVVRHWSSLLPVVPSPPQSPGAGAGTGSSSSSRAFRGRPRSRSASARPIPARTTQARKADWKPSFSATSGFAPSFAAR
jgi:hypothetical protein